MITEQGSDLPDSDAVHAAVSDLHLNPLHEALELVPHVPRTAHRTVLDEVLKAPLGRETCFYPLFNKRREENNDNNNNH